MKAQQIAIQMNNFHSFFLVLPREEQRYTTKLVDYANSIEQLHCNVT